MRGHLKALAEAEQRPLSNYCRLVLLNHLEQVEREGQGAFYDIGKTLEKGLEP